jgi:hypothetical protein
MGMGPVGTGPRWPYSVVFHSSCLTVFLAHSVVVWEHADDIGSPFDLLVDALERVNGPDLATVAPWEGRAGGHVVFRVRKHGGGLGQ